MGINIGTIIDRLHKERMLLAILTMVGLLGAVDVFCNSVEKGDNIILLSIKWFSISFLFASILSYLMGTEKKPIKWITSSIIALYGLLLHRKCGLLPILGIRRQLQDVHHHPGDKQPGGRGIHQLHHWKLHIH